jgi:hypothetical protein
LLLAFEHAGEDLEARAAEMLGDVLHLDRIAQVRLVGAVLAHRFGVGNARPVLVTDLPSRELLEDAGDHRLHRGEHVLLLDEAHLDVELVELARQAIGARVLVAEAGRDLEVAVEARHHQELLVLLRRLRQRVELAGDGCGSAPGSRARPRGSTPSGSASGIRRSPLDFMRWRIESITLPRSHDVLVQLLAAQIEEAVFQPRILRVFEIAEHRQRQFGRPAPALRAR